MVVDFGTAVTYDVVSGAGEYLGGVIFPGVEISLEALTERAAALPKIDLTRAARALIGKTTSTRSAPASSTASRAWSTGSSAACARSWARTHAIATGGLAGAIVPFCDGDRRGRRPAHAHRAAADLGAQPRLESRAMRSLHDPWTLGGLTIPNRVVLAPLAGIGNWFVRLQAKRYGAGLAVSEMVSSFAIHYGNRKTLDELLVIHPDERAGGPVSVQLFGHDPEIMRSAAATVARAGADLIDLNMGCPVPKVCKTGAGAALLGDPDTAVAVARAAREGSGLPVTVKLRAGRKPGESEGVEVAHRLVEEAGVAGISFHPRSAAVRHKGTPDYDLAKELVESLPVPVIVSGGLDAPDHIRWVFDHTGAAAVMLARGSLGNPWLFAQLLEDRGEPTREEILDELDWIVDRAVEHLGEDRAARYLRKFHPWYLARLGEPRSTQAGLQCASGLEEQREILRNLRYHAPPLARRAA